MNRFFLYSASSLLLATALWGCSTAKQNASSTSSSFTYKLEIVQGNFVSSEQVAALRTGMPRAQVKNILGTPLLTDVFHADRWDYVFTLTRDGKINTIKRLTVHFKNDVLDKHEGDAMPSEVEFIKTLDSGRKVEKVPPLEASQQQLLDFAKRENPSSRAIPSSASGATPAPADANKSYPALESK
jgi:outer membrane protein assembly factor BamE